MQFYGRAEESAKRILSAFESGDVPKALAPIFIKMNDRIPCRSWSWSNQLITALCGYDDARGFRQWEKVKRHVRKGEKGFPILVQLTQKIEVTDGESDRFVAYGFKHAIVFGYEQTDGEPLPDRTVSDRFRPFSGRSPAGGRGAFVGFVRQDVR